MNQLERIVFINRTIEEYGGIQTVRILSEFAISRRQVLRDLAYMREQLQAPLAYDPKQKWYTYTQPFTLFSNSNERLLVFNAIFRSLAQSQGLMSTLTEMLSEGLDSGVEKSYRSLSEKIIFITPVQDWPDYEIFNRICSAMKCEERMTMHYRNAAGQESNRHIEPVRLVNYSGRWYLLAFDLKHHQLRTFHLSRILSIAQIVGDRMQRRYAEAELNAFVNAGYGIFLGKEITYVTFRVYDWAKETLSTQTWHAQQKVRRVMEGQQEALEVTLPVADLHEILSSLLSFGVHARPVSPPEFVDMYKAMVQDMALHADFF
ncbi:MAG: helix-turn-helix transcriptional regulator [Sphaerochaeta sp.]|jgi:predicted DNA-binding transcriptional regulator YafY|uniref:helix-turn-helix transcriptional regulator n=1 Tax=Sphaerochaeta sp. TaxID=1972642 RepID=UPI002FCB38C8